MRHLLLALWVLVLHLGTASPQHDALPDAASANNQTGTAQTGTLEEFQADLVLYDLIELPSLT